MTLTLMITANVVLDVLLLGLLAFAMTRARKLTPHVPERELRSLSVRRRRQRALRPTTEVA